MSTSHIPTAAARRVLALALLVAAAACDGGPTGGDPGDGAGGGGGGGGPTLTRVTVTPGAATVAAGASARFQAEGLWSDGATHALDAAWSATGGTVTAGGLFTAGPAAGSFRVVATAPGGKADTAAVTVTAAPPAGGGYTAAIGDDWRGYAGKAALRARDYFGWTRSEDVYDHVDLVPDPTFGQVVRIRFQQSDQTGFAPRMQKALPQPLGHIWFRWRIRYVPGWTTVGPNPSGYANSWKMAFWTWKDYYARGAIQLSNGDQNIMEWGVMDPATGKWYSYAEQLLPGSVGQPLGSVGDAWRNGEWYEYVIHYQRLGSNQAKQEYWYRRLTRGGAISDEPFLYHGAVFTGTPIPLVDGIQLGVNKNKSNPTTMYLMWGPWEVVDGDRHPDPFGIPGR